MNTRPHKPRGPRHARHRRPHPTKPRSPRTTTNKIADSERVRAASTQLSQRAARVNRAPFGYHPRPARSLRGSADLTHHGRQHLPNTSRRAYLEVEAAGSPALSTSSRPTRPSPDLPSFGKPGSGVYERQPAFLSQDPHVGRTVKPRRPVHAPSAQSQGTSQSAAMPRVQTPSHPFQHDTSGVP
jgi:hypothetical protein